MKCSKLKRIFSFALCFVVCIPLLFGCSKQEQQAIAPMGREEVDTFSFDILGGVDVMPIGGFHGPMD